MSLFRNEIQTALFRFIKFYVNTSSLSGGSRLKVWEYPNQDENYIEDLGLKTKEFQVDAFVVGDDYIQQRDNLIAELDQGYGRLEHPVYGNFYAYVDSYTVDEDFQSDGRMAKISITFKKSGKQGFPDIGFNIVGQIFLKINIITSQLTNLVNKFYTAETPSNIPDIMLSVRDIKNSYNKQLSEMSTDVNSIVSVVSTIGQTLGTLIETPNELTRIMISTQNEIANSVRQVVGADRRRAQLNLYKDQISIAKEIIQSAASDSNINRTGKQLIGSSLAVNLLGNAAGVSADFGLIDYSGDKLFYNYLIDEIDSMSDFLQNQQAISENAFPDIFFENQFDDIEKELNDIRTIYHKQYNDLFNSVTRYVATGEPLTVICFKVYGNLSRIDELYQFNSIPRPDYVIGELICPK